MAELESRVTPPTPEELVLYQEVFGHNPSMLKAVLDYLNGKDMDFVVLPIDGFPYQQETESDGGSK